MFYALPSEIETEKQKIILVHPQMEVFLKSIKEDQISWESGNSFLKLGKETSIMFNGNYLEPYNV